MGAFLSQDKAPDAVTSGGPLSNQWAKRAEYSPTWTGVGEEMELLRMGDALADEKHQRPELRLEQDSLG